MPNSTTATSGLVRNSRSESGRPIWLLRFPLFLNTRYRDDKNSADTSFVVVFPALPVIATTRDPERRLTSRATSCNARVVSSTWITTGAGPAAAGRSLGTSCTSAPMAPRARTSPTNRCPSNRSPLIATKKSPTVSVLESIAIRPMCVPASPRTTRPPAAAAISAALSANGSTRYDTRERARRRARALLATSTSSNGSTRPPISWYFS